MSSKRWFPIALLFIALGAGCKKPEVLSRDLTREEMETEDDVQILGRGKEIVSPDGLVASLAINPDIVPDVASPERVIAAPGSRIELKVLVANTSQRKVTRLSASLFPDRQVLTAVIFVKRTADLPELAPGASAFFSFEVRVRRGVAPGAYPLFFLCSYDVPGDAPPGAATGKGPGRPGRRNQAFARWLEIAVPAVTLESIRPASVQPAEVKEDTVTGAPFPVERWQRNVVPVRASAVLGYNLVMARDDERDFEIETRATSARILRRFVPRLVWPSGQGIAARLLETTDLGGTRRRLRVRIVTRRARRGVHRIALLQVHRDAGHVELERHVLALGVYEAAGARSGPGARRDHRLTLTTPEGALFECLRTGPSVGPGPDRPSLEAQRHYLERQVPRVLSSYFTGARIAFRSTEEFERRLARIAGIAPMARFAARRLAAYHAGLHEGYRLYATLGQRTVAGRAEGALGAQIFSSRLTRVAALAGAHLLCGLAARPEVALQGPGLTTTIARGDAHEVRLSKIDQRHDAGALAPVRIDAVKVYSRADEEYEGKALGKVMEFQTSPVYLRFDVRRLRERFSLRGTFPLALLVRGGARTRTHLTRVGGDAAEFYLGGLGKGTYRLAPYYHDRERQAGGVGRTLAMRIRTGEPARTDDEAFDPLILLSPAERKAHAAGEPMATLVSMRAFRGAGDFESTYVFSGHALLDEKKVSQRLVKVEYDQRSDVTRCQVALRASKRRKWVVEWIPQQLERTEDLGERTWRRPAQVAHLEFGPQPLLASFAIKGRLGRDFHDLKTRVSGSPALGLWSLGVRFVERRGLFPGDPGSQFTYCKKLLEGLRQVQEIVHLLDVGDHYAVFGSDPERLIGELRPLRPARFGHWLQLIGAVVVPVKKRQRMLFAGGLRRLRIRAGAAFPLLVGMHCVASGDPPARRKEPWGSVSVQSNLAVAAGHLLQDAVRSGVALGTGGLSRAALSLDLLARMHSHLCGEPTSPDPANWPALAPIVASALQGCRLLLETDGRLHAEILRSPARFSFPVRKVIDVTGDAFKAMGKDPLSVIVRMRLEGEGIWPDFLPVVHMQGNIGLKVVSRIHNEPGKWRFSGFAGSHAGVRATGSLRRVGTGLEYELVIYLRRASLLAEVESIALRVADGIGSGALRLAVHRFAFPSTPISGNEKTRMVELWPPYERLRGLVGEPYPADPRAVTSAALEHVFNHVRDEALRVAREQKVSEHRAVESAKVTVGALLESVKRTFARVLRSKGVKEGPQKQEAARKKEASR